MLSKYTIVSANIANTTEWKIIDKKKKKVVIGNISEAGLQNIGIILLTSIKDRMALYISTKYKYKVGATNKSSENLSVEVSKDDVSIVEGNATKGTYFIRMGWKGTGSKDVPKDALRRWVQAKGIRLVHPDDMGKQRKKPIIGDLNIRSTRIIKSKTKAGKPYIRAYTHKDIADAAIKNMSDYLGATGSSWTHFMRLPPLGKGKFDFPAKAIRHDRSINKRILNKASEDFVTAFVEWYSTGRKTHMLTEMRRE